MQNEISLLPRAISSNASRLLLLLYITVNFPWLCCCHVLTVTASYCGMIKSLWNPCRIRQHFGAGMLASLFVTVITAPGERTKCLMQVCVGCWCEVLMWGACVGCWCEVLVWGCEDVIMGHTRTHIHTLHPSLHPSLPTFIPPSLPVQIQQVSRRKAHYSSSIDCVKQLYPEGGIRNVYKGYVATMLRGVCHLCVCWGGGECVHIMWCMCIDVCLVHVFNPPCKFLDGYICYSP